MSAAWSYILPGVAFCLAGIFLFQRSVLEEKRSIGKPLLLIIAGVILVAIGMSKFPPI